MCWFIITGRRCTVSWATTRPRSATTTRAIELYPDFANAYLGRSVAALHDSTIMEGSRSRQGDGRASKIAEYRSEARPTAASLIYADTSTSLQSSCCRSRASMGGSAGTQRPELREVRQHRAAADVQVLAGDVPRRFRVRICRDSITCAQCRAVPHATVG